MLYLLSGIVDCMRRRTWTDQQLLLRKKLEVFRRGTLLVHRWSGDRESPMILGYRIGSVAPHMSPDTIVLRCSGRSGKVEIAIRDGDLNTRYVSERNSAKPVLVDLPSVKTESGEETRELVGEEIAAAYIRHVLDETPG